MTIPQDVRDCLTQYVASYPADRVVQIAPYDRIEIDYGTASLDCLRLSNQFDPVTDLVSIGQVDLALVIDAPRVLSTVKTRQLLAHLRNYTAPATVAAFDSDAERHNSAWSMSEFLGLGFRRLSEARALSSRYWIYRYDIHDYKITPDWLNARYWANPREWDRRRW